MFMQFKKKKKKKSRWNRRNYSKLPSRRTTTGTFKFILSYAFVIPLATVAQFTIPPNILTKITAT